MPRASSATSRRSASTAASTACGRTAACCTSRRSDDPKHPLLRAVRAGQAGPVLERPSSAGDRLAADSRGGPRRDRRGRRCADGHQPGCAGITSGFDFLSRPAGFEIARGPLSFSSLDTYARALLVGLLNTVRVSLLGIAIATSLGLLIGIARLSGIWIVSTVARVYVEVMRNTPLLLQLLFWYTLTQGLPAPSDALKLLPG